MAAHPCAAAAAPCPDLTGRYLQTGDEPLYGDVRDALGFGSFRLGPPDGRHVLLETAEGGLILKIQALDRSQQRPPADAWRMLQQGTDFDCADGWLTLRRTVVSSRPGSRQDLPGNARVRLRRDSAQGLLFQVAFSGRARIPLFQYESAKVDLPLPGTGRSETGTLSWPPAPPPPPPPDPADEARRGAEELVRARLESLLAGRVTIGPVRLQDDGTLVQLTALTASDQTAAEDRLRAAGVAYEVEREPVWAERGYRSQIRVLDGGNAAQERARPSAFRVAAELRRLLGGNAREVQVRRLGGSYVAEVALDSGMLAQGLADSLPARSALIARVVPLPAGQPPAAGAREPLRWLVTLRP